LKYDDEGNVRPRFNANAYALIINARAKVAADLMRYGYGRVPETNTTEVRELPPIIVRTTKEGDELPPLGGDTDDDSSPFKGTDE